MQWNEKGELIFHEKVVFGSHITDLLRDSLRKYKSFTPDGREEFHRGLRELNVPKSLIEQRPQSSKDLAEGTQIQQMRPPGIPKMNKRFTTPRPTWLPLK